MLRQPIKSDLDRAAVELAYLKDMHADQRAELEGGGAVDNGDDAEAAGGDAGAQVAGEADAEGGADPNSSSVSDALIYGLPI